jgi:hypothetical protein
MCPPISELVNSPYASGWFLTMEWTVSFGQLQMKLQLVSRGVFQIEALQTTRKSSAARTHRNEIHSHTLSDGCKDRNNAAEHTAEIAVASHRTAEIE